VTSPAPQPPPDGAATTTVTLRIGGRDLSVRALADRQQFSDPNGEAERLGVSSAAWPLFGLVWPAGRALAEEMMDFPIAGKRILEVGCGLGLASLVLAMRGADVTASDQHPRAGEFLQHNAGLNGLPAMTFARADWAAEDPAHGTFDLIIGSDVLYERDQPALLAGFLGRHARADAEVVIADPGRAQCGQFSRRLEAQGYARTEKRRALEPGERPPYRGRIMTFRRRAPGR
jgi:predicted nicotinamide N-methyase